MEIETRENRKRWIFSQTNKNAQQMIKIFQVSISVRPEVFTRKVHFPIFRKKIKLKSLREIYQVNSLKWFKLENWNKLLLEKRQKKFVNWKVINFHRLKLHFWINWRKLRWRGKFLERYEIKREGKVCLGNEKF
jgi:hypothetical protein